MKERIARMMQGRYGGDQFSQFLSGVALVLLILSLFVRNRLLSSVALVLLIYIYFRMFSKNISKRYKENLKYLEATAGIRRNVRKRRARTQQRKLYRFYKCPACSQEVRVPKGKGKIEIDCPKCHTKFIKRS